MILFIDTSLEKCVVALSWKNETVDCIVYDDAYKASEVLHQLIEDILKRNELTLKNLKGIAVNGGPGSYTGLRIGITAAKGFCYILDLPLIHLDGLALLTHHLVEKYKDKYQYYIPMIDARRMEVFTCVYDAEFNLVEEAKPYILNANDFEQYDGKKVLIFGNGAEKAMTIIKKENIVFTKSKTNSTTYFNNVIWENWKVANFVDIHTYSPNYLKKFYSNIKN